MCNFSLSHTVSSQDLSSLLFSVISVSNFQHCVHASKFFREIAMFSSKKFNLTKKNFSSTFLSIFFFLTFLSNSNARQKPAEGWFLSKWVYKFLPSQKHVQLSGYFKHHIGGGQLPKNRCKILYSLA